MEDNEESNNESKFDRVRKHLKENWKIYVVGTGGIIVGAAGMAIFLTKKYGVTEDDMLEMGMTQMAAIIKDSTIKKSTVNLTQKTISMQGNTIGRPGIPIVDTTTGKAYTSISRAADALDLDMNRIRRNLEGRNDHVNGHIFKTAE